MPIPMPVGVPLMDALDRFDLVTAHRLYEREAAGRSPAEVWRTAALHRRHDLLLAVLVLHRHQGIERRLWETPREGSLNGELQRVLTGNFAPSLVDYVKQRPYYSERPERITQQNLNCELQFIQSPQPEVIACRHLAIAWLLQIEASGKPDYEILGDKTLLPQHVGFATQDLFRRMAENAPVRLVPLADWGAFIAAQLAEIAASGGPQSRRFFINSNTHALACELKVKPGPNGPRYVANVYDPNITAAHKRTASPSLQRFEALQASDLVRNAQSMAAYFAGEEEATVLWAPPDGVESLPPRVPGGDPERRVGGPVPLPTASVVFRLMHIGAAGSLRDLLPAFADLAESDPQLAATVLEGRQADGTPALHIGMQYGLVHAVQAYAALVATMVPDLDPDDHIRLLAAHQPNGTPALFMAMQNGRTPVIGPFFELVQTSGLSIEAQIDLLAGRTSDDGFPCLAMAIQEDRLEAASAYLDAMARHSGLGIAGQVSLLAATGQDGRTALDLGLMQGEPATLEAVVKWIAGRESFSAADRCELLLARDSEGMPALARAMEEDFLADNVRAFVSAVLASPMEEMDKVNVLLGGASPGDLLLHARAHDGAECIAAYREEVLAARPSLAVQLMLLSEVPRRRRN
jgi:ShET2 enterotoxin, N-terminal region